MRSLPEFRKKLDATVDRSIALYEALCIFCFSVMIVIALIQIANRHIPIEHPWSLRWTVAWSVRFMLFTAFLGIGLVHIFGEDIVISTIPDWVADNAPKPVNSLYEFVINVAVLGMLGFLAVATYGMMMNSWDVGTSPDFFFWFRQGHLYLILFIGLFVALLYRTVKTGETLDEVFGKPIRERLRPYLDKLWN